MTKTITTALIAAASLSLAACGGSKTENVTVTNEVTLDDGSANLTAIDTLNDAGVAPDNAAIETGNAADLTGNTVTNATDEGRAGGRRKMNYRAGKQA